MRGRIPTSLGVLAVALVTVLPAGVLAQQAGAGIPRTPDGHPDLSGSYDTATLTPLQRSEHFGNRLFLTEEEAVIAAGESGSLEALFNIPRERNERSDPNRVAPPVGGDRSTGAAGNVGGYNSFWIDRGTGAFRIDGQWRTSIITAPENGRHPPLTEAGRNKAAAGAQFLLPNTGTAWWLENDLNAPGPYDDPELRSASERCLLGFGSTAGPPMLPVLYNNLKKIVQTEDYVMILVEMVHDARIVRMNQEHAPPDIRQWLGDSVGYWEGTPWSSTPQTSPLRPRSPWPRGTYTWSSASRASTRIPSSTNLRLTAQRFGLSPGVASMCGRQVRIGYTSTRATRRTTPSGPFCEVRGFSKPKLGASPDSQRYISCA